MQGERETGFNDHSETVEISGQDRIIGPKIYEYYIKTLIRPLPWDIKGGKIVVLKKFDAHAEVETIPGEKYEPDLQERVIITEGLEKEQISPGLARTIEQHKIVEDRLSDFTRRGEEINRNNMGLSMAGKQWSREELQHSLGLGLILEATGNKTLDDIVDKYYESISQTWEPPFNTQRRMVIYPSFQELNTGDNYEGMELQAIKEEAPITASIIGLIKKDERYHGGGYRKFVQIFYEEDPEGTLEDVLHVARNFRMPSQNLVANPRQALSDLVKYTGFDRERVAYGTIQRTLKGFGFVPEAKIKEVVNGYLKAA